MITEPKVGDTFRVFEVAYPVGLSTKFKGRTCIENKYMRVSIYGMYFEYLELKQVGTIRIKSLKNNS